MARWSWPGIKSVSVEPNANTAPVHATPQAVSAAPVRGPSMSAPITATVPRSGGKESSIPPPKNTNAVAVAANPPTSSAAGTSSQPRRTAMSAAANATSSGTRTSDDAAMVGMSAYAKACTRHTPSARSRVNHRIAARSVRSASGKTGGAHHASDPPATWPPTQRTPDCTGAPTKPINRGGPSGSAPGSCGPDPGPPGRRPWRAPRTHPSRRPR